MDSDSIKMQKVRAHKLTAENEQHILRLLDERFSVAACAERFSVGASTILRVKRKFRPPSAPTASQRVRRHRKMGFLEKQFLFHKVDLQQGATLGELADEFCTDEKEIAEVIRARKRLVPAKCGHLRNETESGEFDK